ncbi:hypothetical protein ACLMJK_006294 [Lecanora helva]
MQMLPGSHILVPLCFPLIVLSCCLGRITEVLCPRRRTNWDEVHEQQSAKVERRKPAPHPKGRRNLSKSDITLGTQPLNQLTKLPYELRMRIFQMVYSDNIIHVTFLSRRMIHDVIGVTDRTDCRNTRVIAPVEVGVRHDWPGGDVVEVWDDDDWTGGDDGIVQESHHAKLSLLFQTSRQIYRETISLIYNNNVFSIHSPLTLIYLHDYILLPQRFSSIRHLHLKWDRLRDWTLGHWTFRCHPDEIETWFRFWNMVARMKLLSLSLELTIWIPSRPYNLEADYMKPLLKVRGVRQAGVRLLAYNYGNNGFSITREEPEVEAELIRHWTSPSVSPV